jgi:SnoaL-like domain
MKGFDPRWKDLPDYILGITKEIWEDRNVHALRGYYEKNMAKRAPDGVVIGAEKVIAETLGALAVSPGLQILGEDVIWSGDEDQGFLSSHRSIIFMPHTQEGPFGKPTGKLLWQYCIADCACRGNVIYDEWLVHDTAAHVRQLGIEPKAYAGSIIDREGGPDKCNKPFTPERDVAAQYKGKGNMHPIGQRYAEILTRIMQGDLAAVEREYDRGCHLQLPSGVTGYGRPAADQFWLGLRAVFPSAKFEIRHQIGREDKDFPPRAALRWSLTGTHDGWGSFGAPTGAKVYVLGISHAEFGPWGLRREYILIDEISIWKQIILKTG